MQCGVEEKMIRRVGVAEVEYFKCGEKEHKYRECSLWEKKRATHMVKPQKAQQKERPAHSIKGKAQERSIRRTEEGGVACVAKP